MNVLLELVVAQGLQVQEEKQVPVVNLVLWDVQVEVGLPFWNTSVKENGEDE